MKKATLPLILACLTALLLLAGCDFPSGFVIMNLSDEMVDITYAFKNSPGVEFSCDAGNMFTSPGIESAENMEDRDLEWQPLDPGELVCDPTARTVFVPLGPGAALKVMDHDDPGAEFSTRDLKVFPVESLLINSPTGSILYRGDRVLRAFERGNAGKTFYLTYK